MKKIEYKDNILTLCNYKEPLTEIPKGEGFGYWGTIACTIDGEYIQCHICGELFRDVGSHARQKHKINVRDYKDKFKLKRTNVLLSEFERIKRKQTMLDYLKTLTEEEKWLVKQKALEAWKERGYRKRLEAGQPKKSLEQMNEEDICPDQQLEKIKECRDRIGHTPTLNDFINYCDGSQRYKHLIFKTFGSWTNALKVLEMTPKERSKGKYKTYDAEQLLEYLRIYTQENGKIPTATDSKRGLIPPYEVYQRHFGSFISARKYANVEEFL